MTTKPITIAAIGLDHRHIYTMVGNLIAAGAVCKGFWTKGEPEPLAGFLERYPDIPRVADRDRLLDDPDIDLILTAERFCDRAGTAIEAMRRGKDVLTDKPGCTSFDNSPPSARRWPRPAGYGRWTSRSTLKCPRPSRRSSWCAPAPSGASCRPLVLVRID